MEFKEFFVPKKQVNKQKYLSYFSVFKSNKTFKVKQAALKFVLLKRKPSGDFTLKMIHCN